MGSLGAHENIKNLMVFTLFSAFGASWGSLWNPRGGLGGSLGVLGVSLRDLGVSSRDPWGSMGGP